MKISKKTIEKMNNYQLMVFATEEFMNLLYFLEQERDWNNIKFKIGTFEYDGWNADIYCTLNKYGVQFYHIRDIDGFKWEKKTLSEMFIYAWDFESTEFNINFDLINKYYNILNEEDKAIYDELYNEIHCKLW